MPKYKVTKVFIVDATSKQEAVDKVVANPDTLEYVSVKPIEEKGWLKTAKEMVTG